MNLPTNELAFEIRNVTIHALADGQPLCGFTTNPPDQWPKGHVFVSIVDHEHIDCITCKAEAVARLNPKPEEHV